MALGFAGMKVTSAKGHSCAYVHKTINYNMLNLLYYQIIIIIIMIIIQLIMTQMIIKGHSCAYPLDRTPARRPVLVAEYGARDYNVI